MGVFHFRKTEKMLGKEHPSTLTSMNNLASVLSRQGKYDEAEEMHRQAMALKETVLGKEHPDTLTSVYCLTYLLHQKKQYKDAEVFYHRAYAGYTALPKPSPTKSKQNGTSTSHASSPAVSAYWTGRSVDFPTQPTTT